MTSETDAERKTRQDDDEHLRPVSPSSQPSALRDALKPFAKMADKMDIAKGKTVAMVSGESDGCFGYLKIKDFRAARAALSSPEAQPGETPSMREALCAAWEFLVAHKTIVPARPIIDKIDAALSAPTPTPREQELETALRPFAKEAGYFLTDRPDTAKLGHVVTIGDCRHARALLAGSKP